MLPTGLCVIGAYIVFIVLCYCQFLFLLCKFSQNKIMSDDVDRLESWRKHDKSLSKRGKGKMAEYEKGSSRKKGLLFI